MTEPSTADRVHGIETGPNPRQLSAVGITRLAEMPSVVRSVSPDRPLLGPLDDVMPSTVSEVSSDILTSQLDHQRATRLSQFDPNIMELDIKPMHSDKSETKTQQMEARQHDVISKSSLDLDPVKQHEMTTADDRPRRRGGTIIIAGDSRHDSKGRQVADKADDNDSKLAENKGRASGSEDAAAVSRSIQHAEFIELSRQYTENAHDDNTRLQIFDSIGNAHQELNGNTSHWLPETTGNLHTYKVHAQARGDFIQSEIADPLDLSQQTGERISRKRPGQRSKLPVKNLRSKIDPIFLTTGYVDTYINPPKSEPNISDDANSMNKNERQTPNEQHDDTLIKSNHEPSQSDEVAKLKHGKYKSLTGINLDEVYDPLDEKRNLFQEQDGPKCQRCSRQKQECLSNSCDKNGHHINEMLGINIDRIFDRFSHNLSVAVNRVARTEAHKLHLNLEKSFMKGHGCGKGLYSDSSFSSTSYVDVQSNSVQVSLGSVETLEQTNSESAASETLTSVWENVTPRLDENIVASELDQNIQDGNRLNNVCLFSDDSDCETPTSVKEMCRKRKTKYSRFFRGELAKNIHVAVKDLAVNPKSKRHLDSKYTNVENSVERREYDSELNELNGNDPDIYFCQYKISKSVHFKSKKENFQLDNSISPQISEANSSESKTSANTFMVGNVRHNYQKSNQIYHFREDSPEKKCKAKINISKHSHEKVMEICQKQKYIEKNSGGISIHNQIRPKKKYVSVCDIKKCFDEHHCKRYFEYSDQEKTKKSNASEDAYQDKKRLKKMAQSKSNTEIIGKSPMRQSVLPAASTRCKVLEDLSLTEYRRAINLLEPATHPEPRDAPRLHTSSCCNLHNLRSTSEETTTFPSLNLDELSTPKTEDIERLCREGTDSCEVQSDLCQEDSDTICNDAIHNHHQSMAQIDTETYCKEIPPNDVGSQDDRTSETISEENVFSEQNSPVKTISYVIEKGSSDNFIAPKSSLLPMVGVIHEKSLPKLNRERKLGVKTKRTASAESPQRSRHKYAEQQIRRHVDRVRGKQSPGLAKTPPEVQVTRYREKHLLKNKLALSPQRSEIRSKRGISLSPQRNETKNKNEAAMAPRIKNIKKKNRSASPLQRDLNYPENMYTPQMNNIKQKSIEKKLIPYKPVNKMEKKKAIRFNHAVARVHYVSPYRPLCGPPTAPTNSPISSEVFKKAHCHKKTSQTSKHVKLPSLNVKRTPQNFTTNHLENQPSKALNGRGRQHKKMTSDEFFLSLMAANHKNKLPSSHSIGLENPAETQLATDQLSSDEIRMARKSHSFTAASCPPQCLPSVANCASSHKLHPASHQGLMTFPPRVTARGRYYPSKNAVCVTVKPLNCQIHGENLDLQVRVMCRSQRADDSRLQSAPSVRRRSPGRRPQSLGEILTAREKSSLGVQPNREEGLPASRKRPHISTVQVEAKDCTHM